MEKKYKHYYNLSLLCFVIVILLGCFTAMSVYQLMYVASYVDINIYLFDFIVLFVGYIVSVSLYYLGKYLFGLLSGYRLICFNFWFISFIQGKDKVVIKPSSLIGLGCYVKMAPKKENPSYRLYLLGGLIFSLPISIIMILIAIFLPTEMDLKYYLIFIFGMIPFVCVGNLLPFRYELNNDGFLLRLIHKEKGPLLFHRNLAQEEALTNGKSELKYYEYKEVTSPFVLDGLYFNYYYLIDHQEYTKANRICETLIEYENEITDSTKLYLGYTGKIYEMCRQKRFEESDRYFRELKGDIRRVVRNKHNYESIKICLYVAAYMETNYDEFLSLYYRKDKESKKYQYMNRIHLEEKIIDDTIKSIQQDHKDWFVE